MSIIKTKLSSSLILSPEVRTNTLFVGLRNLYNELFTSGIFEKGFSTELYINDLLLSEEDTITFTKQHSCRLLSLPIDDNYKFDLLPTYNNAPRYIKSISITRVNGDNSSLTNYDVKLFVKVYGLDGNEITSVYSSTKTRQKSGLYTTTWDFTNFALKPYYKKLVIGFYAEDKTLDEGFIAQNCIRVGCWRKNESGDGELLSQDLKISWNSNNSWQSHSPNISVKLVTEVPAMLDHYKDFSIHLDENDRAFLASIVPHVENNVIHLTAEEKEKLDKLTVDDGSTKLLLLEHINVLGLHWSSTDRTLLYTLNRHANNGLIHITSELKHKVNSHLTNNAVHVSATEKKKLENLNFSTEITDDSTSIPTTDLLFRELYSYSDFTQVTSNYDEEINGSDKAHAFGTIVLTKNHFITGVLRKLTFYHDNVGGNGVSTDEGYLCVQVYKNDTAPWKTYYSSAPSSFNSSKKYVFAFNDVLLPEDYTRVEMSMVSDDTVTPIIGSGTNTIKMRAYVLTSSENSDNEGNVYPGNDDGCLLYWHGGGSGNHVIRYTAEWATGDYDSRLNQMETKLRMMEETIALLQAKIEELVSGTSTTNS